MGQVAPPPPRPAAQKGARVSKDVELLAPLLLPQRSQIVPKPERRAARPPTPPKASLPLRSGQTPAAETPSALWGGAPGKSVPTLHGVPGLLLQAHWVRSKRLLLQLFRKSCTQRLSPGELWSLLSPVPSARLARASRGGEGAALRVPMGIGEGEVQSPG